MPVLSTTLRTRWLPVSAMYRFPGFVEREVLRRIQLTIDGRCVLICRAIAGGAVSGDRRDEACSGVDLPNAIVPRVGNVEVAERIHRDSMRTVQLRRGPRCLHPARQSSQRCQCLQSC